MTALTAATIEAAEELATASPGSRLKTPTSEVYLASATSFADTLAA